MLESVLIQNFKGFRDTRIDGFRPVNLVIGGQNVGKTSLLEAVLFALRGEISLAFRQAPEPSEGPPIDIDDDIDVDSFRRGITTDPDFCLTAKFGNVDFQLARAGRTTRIASQRQLHVKNSRVRFGGHLSGSHLSSELQMTAPNPTCSAISVFLPLHSQMVQLLGRVIVARKKRDIVQLLFRVEPRLLSLEAIAPEGIHRVYAELDGLPQALPLSHLGHGFSRLVHLFSELLVSDAQLALIDEIENGIHYSALPTLFQGIKAVAQDRQVQTLMTTHSWDALRAAAEVFKDTPELFQVIRLERTPDDNVQAVIIDSDELRELIARGYEVR